MYFYYLMYYVSNNTEEIIIYNTSIRKVFDTMTVFTNVEAPSRKAPLHQLINYLSLLTY